jgi:aerobic carbon-monoxide dehydrogenase medium subunit
VRNMGTIGGTLAHGDPASDLPAVLLAHEGSVVLRGPGGEREVAAADFFEDFLTTVVAEDEILTHVKIPALEGYGYGYEKFNRRQEDWAMVAVSALVKKAADGTCEDVRVGLTHMGSTPLRATAVEAALRGRPLTPDAIAEAAENAAEGTDPPADLHGSSDYRGHLAKVLTARALAAAAAR